MKELVKKGLVLGLSVVLAAGVTGCSKTENQETDQTKTTEASDDGIVINDDGSMSVDPSKAGIDVEEMNPNPTDKEEEMFKASEFTAPYKDSYEYPHMGLRFSLGDSIKDSIENKDLVLLDEQENEDGPGNVRYGLFTISRLNEDQKNAEISTLGDGYVEWLNSIERVGNVGMFKSDMTEEEIKEVSKNDSLLKLGESDDKNFVYYLTYKSGDKDMEALKDEIEAEVIDRVDMPKDGYLFAENNNISVEKGSDLSKIKTKTIEGKDFTGEDFSKYDLTMVNVFATWCSPCVKEIPDINEAYKDLKDKNINVIGIVTDTFDDKGENEEAIEKSKLIKEKTKADYDFVMPDESQFASRLIGIQSLPETFFVDKNGQIVGETYSGARSKEEWKTVIEKELENVKK